MSDHGIPGTALYAEAKARVAARYTPLARALAPMAVPRRARGSVVHGYVYAPITTEELVRVEHFMVHGLPLVLRGTAWEMTP